MNEKVLVFGSEGFVGKYLADEFRQNGYKVYCSDICKNNSINLAEFFKCNLLDERQVKNIIMKINPAYIVNLAAISSVNLSWKIPQKTIAVNIEGTLNILEAVKKYNTEIKILLIGSSEEYSKSDIPIKENFKLDSKSPYGISKIAQERFAEIYRSRYGIKIYCVRAFNHTGIGQSDSFVIPSWCKQVAEISKRGSNGTINVGNLNIKRDFSDVRDIVRAYRIVIESDNHETVYNIGSGKSYALNDILNYIISLSKQKITVNIDKNLFRISDNPIVCCDNTLIVQKLGWQVRYDIYDTINMIFNYYLKGGIIE